MYRSHLPESLQLHTLSAAVWRVCVVGVVNLKHLSIQAPVFKQQEPHEADGQVSSCIQKLFFFSFFPGLNISEGMDSELL